MTFFTFSSVVNDLELVVIITNTPYLQILFKLSMNNSINFDSSTCTHTSLLGEPSFNLSIKPIVRPLEAQDISTVRSIAKVEANSGCNAIPTAKGSCSGHP